MLLGDKLGRKVRLYLIALRSSGAVVNTAVAIGCAKGIVNMPIFWLAVGGAQYHKVLGKELAELNGVCEAKGHYHERALPRPKSQWRILTVKKQYFLDIKNVTEMDEIPDE